MLVVSGRLYRKVCFNHLKFKVVKRILVLVAFLVGLLTMERLHAQVVTEVFNAAKHTVLLKDTTVNVDTSILSVKEMGSRLKAIDVLVLKVSGTVGGKVYVQGTNTGGLSWDNIDSLVNTDVASQKKHVVFTSTAYKSYRTYYITTGTQSSILAVGVLRRPDE